MPNAQRYRNGHRTRELRARVIASEANCRLCGQPVDKTIRNPDPAAPVIDHLIPIARGGPEYERSNLGLMHRACNREKSTKTLEEALSATTPTPPIIASAGWGPTT